MPITIMPPLPLHILSNLVILLRLLQDLHINIHHAHPLLTTILRLIPQRRYKRQRNSRKTRIRVRFRRAPRTARVSEYDSACVLKSPGGEGRGEEEGFGVGIETEAVGGAVS